MCGKTFDKEEESNTHVGNYHEQVRAKTSQEEETFFQCDACGKLFNTICNIEAHIVKEHRETTGQENYYC